MDFLLVDQFFSQNLCRIVKFAPTFLLALESTKNKSVHNDIKTTVWNRGHDTCTDIYKNASINLEFQTLKVKNNIWIIIMYCCSWSSFLHKFLMRTLDTI